jgi:molybdate transport system substrate-binding protein
MTLATRVRINFGTWLLATAFFLLAAGCGQDATQKPTPPPKPGATQPSQPPAGDKLSGAIFVYCAVGAKDAVSELAKSFEADTDVKVRITTANSGQLLGQIELSKIGDVYVPGDTGFVATAKERKLVSDDGKVFCYFVPTIIVGKGNPKGIKELKDLLNPGMRLALADPKAAIGVLQEKVFTKNAIDQEALKKNTVDMPATVAEVALKVKLGAADAGIVWNTVAAQFAEDTQAVAIPLEKNVVGSVPAAVLTCSKNPKAAAAFVDYLVSEEGKKVLVAKHFTVEPPK